MAGGLAIVLATASAATAQQPGTALPAWLVGSWRYTNIFAPSRMTGAERREEFRGFKVQTAGDVLRIHPDWIEYSQTHITTGGADRIEVGQPDRSLADLLGAATAVDSRGRRIGLRKMDGAVHLRPRSCFREAPSDAKRYIDCLSLVVLHPSPNRIRVVYLDGGRTPGKALLQDVMEYTRTSDDAALVDSDDVPASLTGSWRLANVYLVPGLPPDRREAAARMLDGLVGNAVLGLQRNGIDFTRMGFAAGRAELVAVNRFTDAMGRLLDAREVRDAANRRLDLSRPRAVTVILPKSCTETPDRTDRDGVADCVAVIAMRSPVRNHALFIFRKIGSSDGALVPGVLDFKRD